MIRYMPRSLNTLPHRQQLVRPSPGDSLKALSLPTAGRKPPFGFLLQQLGAPVVLAPICRHVLQDRCRARARHQGRCQTAA